MDWAEYQTRPALKALHDQPFVPGEGPTTACRLVVVGEAPGANEAKHGRPFVGRSGQVLMKVFKNNDVARREIYITNVVKFRPPNNSTPTEAEIGASLPYLWEEIREINPHMAPVVLLGSVAKAVIGSSQTITNLRGRMIPYNGFRFMITWHPSYVIRRGGLGSPPGIQLQADIELAVKESENH